MTQMLQSHWMALCIGAALYFATTWYFLKPKELVEQQLKQLTAHQEAAIPKLEPSWAFKNPEMDQMWTELKQEREALKIKTQQLSELEARLIAEKQEITQVTQTVYRLQMELDQSVMRINESETANLKKLVKVYLGMSPEGAARILKEMDDDQIVKLLYSMRESESAPILENLAKIDRNEAKRAAVITSRLRLTTVQKAADKPKTP